DRVNGRLVAWAEAFRRRGGGAHPARSLAARSDGGTAERADAGQRPLSARGRPGRMSPLFRAASPKGLRRVRHARRRQPSRRAGGLTRRSARSEGVQDQPDPVQPDRDVRRLVAEGDRRLQGRARPRPPSRDRPTYARAGNSGRLRPARSRLGGGLTTELTIPETPEDVTPEWLTTALTDSGVLQSGRVATARWSESARTTASPASSPASSSATTVRAAL